MDSLSYRCTFFNALNATHEVVRVSENTSVATRRGLDLIIMPHVCTTNSRTLPMCFRQLVPAADPPLVIVLNKAFENLVSKLRAVQREAARFALLISASPHAAGFGAVAQVPAAFLPYAAALEFGKYHARGPSAARLRFEYDLGFSGGWQKLSGRYPFRASLFGGNATERLRASGVRLTSPGWLTTADYVERLARTRVWFATSELGDHIGTRYFEVLVSGRAMLLCNRNPAAYAPLGLVEGVHAAMFNSTDEFHAKLRHYMEHEAERQALVTAARQLVLSRHLWTHRTSELTAVLHAALERHRGQRERAGGGEPDGAASPRRRGGAAERGAAYWSTLTATMRAERGFAGV